MSVDLCNLDMGFLMKKKCSFSPLPRDYITKKQSITIFKEHHCGKCYTQAHNSYTIMKLLCICAPAFPSNTVPRSHPRFLSTLPNTAKSNDDATTIKYHDSTLPSSPFMHHRIIISFFQIFGS